VLLQDRTAFAQLGVQNAGTEPPWHRRISAPTAQDGRGPNPQRTRSAPARRGKPCARANDQARGAGPVLALTQPKPLEATHKDCALRRPGRTGDLEATRSATAGCRYASRAHVGFGSIRQLGRAERRAAAAIAFNGAGGAEAAPPDGTRARLIAQAVRFDSVGHHHAVVAATCTLSCPSGPVPAMRSRRRSVPVDFPASSAPDVVRGRTASDLPQASSATCRLGAVWHRDTMLGSRTSS
jgi:hypothetical protein